MGRSASSNIATNASFEKNRGGLPWPVDRGYVLLHYGNNKLPNGTIINISCTSVGADIGTPVKAIFDGVVVSVKNIDDLQIVIVQHGKYFSTYSNIGNVTLQKDQTVKTGQVLGKVLSNDDGIGAFDIYISTETNELNPESWLRPR
ncbi:MAG: peptidoglycan DD-metalloendopeptidase family protein [Sphingobacteriales bacterium]|nr:peptidoglycan DD-metalloendopeptidase family protein [Sphingobacteriales bacterium]